MNTIVLNNAFILPVHVYAIQDLNRKYHLIHPGSLVVSPGTAGQRRCIYILGQNIENLPQRPIIILLDILSWHNFSISRKSILFQHVFEVIWFTINFEFKDNLNKYDTYFQDHQSPWKSRNKNEWSTNLTNCSTLFLWKYSKYKLFIYI